MFKGEFYGRISSEYVCMALGGSCNINDYRRNQISPRTSGLACSFNGCVFIFMTVWYGLRTFAGYPMFEGTLNIIFRCILGGFLVALGLIYWFMRKENNYICIKTNRTADFISAVRYFMFIFFVRVDSLQCLKPIMPERGIVTVCTIFNKHFHSGILLLPLSKLSSRTGNGGSPSTFNFTKVRPL